MGVGGVRGAACVMACDRPTLRQWAYRSSRAGLGDLAPVTVNYQGVKMEILAKNMDEAIVKMTAQGYIIVSRSGNVAQLRKPKRFNSLYAVLCWLIIGIGWPFGILQIILHVAAKDHIVSIVEGPTGAYIQSTGWA